MRQLNFRAAVVAPELLLIFTFCFFQGCFKFAFSHSHLPFVCFTLSLSAGSLLLVTLNTNMQPLALSKETNSHKQSDGAFVTQCSLSVYPLNF
jgi:hypothetical protein